MRIRMLDTLATPTECLSVGKAYDIDDGYGKHLIDAGLAEAVDAKDATAGPPLASELTMGVVVATEVAEADKPKPAAAGKRKK